MSVPKSSSSSKLRKKYHFIVSSQYQSLVALFLGISCIVPKKRKKKHEFRRSFHTLSSLPYVLFIISCAIHIKYNVTSLHQCTYLRVKKENKKSLTLNKPIFVCRKISHSLMPKKKKGKRNSAASRDRAC